MRFDIARLADQKLSLSLSHCGNINPSSKSPSLPHDKLVCLKAPRVYYDIGDNMTHNNHGRHGVHARGRTYRHLREHRVRLAIVGAMDGEQPAAVLLCQMRTSTRTTKRQKNLRQLMPQYWTKRRCGGTEHPRSSRRRACDATATARALSLDAVARAGNNVIVMDARHRDGKEVR